MKVHGAVAQPRQGTHGLVLKAFLGPTNHQCAEGQARDYVGDIALQVRAGTPEWCARRLKAQMGSVEVGSAS